MTITLNLKIATAEQLLQAVASFCRIHGAPVCYQNWSPETLRDYLMFHANCGTLVWLQRPLDDAPQLSKIYATGVAWQCNEADIRRVDAQHEHIFNWEPTDVLGDSVFFADFVCCDRCALAQLLENFAGRFPHWRYLKWFTYRHGKLIQLTPRHVRVVLRKAGYVQR